MRRRPLCGEADVGLGRAFHKLDAEKIAQDVPGLHRVGLQLQIHGGHRPTCVDQHAAPRSTAVDRRLVDLRLHDAVFEDEAGARPAKPGDAKVQPLQRRCDLGVGQLQRTEIERLRAPWRVGVERCLLLAVFSRTGF